MTKLNERYSRQIKLPEIGDEGQERIQNTKVLIVGMGGLGCPAAQYLTAAGIGTLGLLDFDRVEETNLHRQVLYGPADLGKPKVEAARDQLIRQNPEVHFQLHPVNLSLENALNLFNQYDIIIDGTDNFKSKYLINDACIHTNKPWIYASIYKYEGQLSVFNFRNGPSYRCLFPRRPEKDLSCEETGVIGVLPGILGTYQASEAVKMILGIGNVSSGKLKIINLLSMDEQTLSFKRNDETIARIKERDIQYEQVACEFDDQAKVYLDVRELNEQPRPSHNNVLSIPMNQLATRFTEIPKEKTIHVYCQSGIRSKKAIHILEDQYGFKNLVNVEGGIQSILK